MITASELFERAKAIAGLTLSQVAQAHQLIIPTDPLKRKGFTGLALEKALGTTAGNKPLPDFHHLGIELKTIPVNQQGRPAESTFVTTVPLLTLHQQTWQTSVCYQKLRRVLFIPVEDAEQIPFTHRRLGEPLLWSPTAAEEKILAADFEEIATLVTMGRLDEINASLGQYLQVRPKAQNRHARCDAVGSDGQRIRTLPRGFYLRAQFTAEILRIRVC